ncbi:hypothetical protein BGX38DRAFT_1182702, partial [Terfezia claveryi]
MLKTRKWKQQHNQRWDEGGLLWSGDGGEWEGRFNWIVGESDRVSVKDRLPLGGDCAREKTRFRHNDSLARVGVWGPYLTLAHRD